MRMNKNEMCNYTIARDLGVFFTFTGITTNISLNRFPTNSDRLKLLKRNAERQVKWRQHAST